MEPVQTSREPWYHVSVWRLLAVFLVFCGLFLLVMSPILLVGWTMEPIPLSVGRVKFLMTLGLICLVLVPVCFVGAYYLFKRVKKEQPVL